MLDLLRRDVRLKVLEPSLDFVRVFLLFLQRLKTFFVRLEVGDAVLAQSLDVVEGFGVPVK